MAEAPDFLTDQQAAALGATPVAPAPDFLTDEQASAMRAALGPMATGEAAARLFYKHLTLGTQPGADRKRAEQAAHEHPVVDLASAVPAFVVQSAALGPLAAGLKGVEAANALGSAARGAGKAIEVGLLPNTAARTGLASARTGAKVGGVFSGAEAAGSDLTDPNKTWADVGRDVPIAAGMGTLAGAGLGAGGHYVARGVGAIANRAFPALAKVREALNAPEAQGHREFFDAAMLDKYSVDDFARLQADLADPAKAHLYAGLNPIEALEVRRLQTMPHTGELKPEPRYSPNLRAAEKDAANAGGEGMYEAITKYGTRKNEMAAQIQAELDALTARHTAAPATLQPALADLANGAKPAPEHPELPGFIDQHFGSGAREADAEAADLAKEAFNKRFNRMRSGKLVMTTELGELKQHSPTFRKAVEGASESAAIDRAAAAVAGGRAPDRGAGAMRPWLTGQVDEGGNVVQILSPADMLSIHHELVMNARPRVGGDPTAERNALRLKKVFADWIAKQYPPSSKLFRDYQVFKRTMEATEHAENLSLSGTGPRDQAALRFLEEQAARVPQLEADSRAAAAAYQRAVESYNAGRRRTMPKLTDVNDAVGLEEAQRRVGDEFRKAWGERLKELFNSADEKKAASLIRQALTPEGQNRITSVLGQQEGGAFLNRLFAMEARNQARSVPLNADPAHTGVRFFNQMQRAGRADAVEAYRHARAEKLASEIDALKAGGDQQGVLDKMLTPSAMRHNIEVFGRERGEALTKHVLRMDAANQGAKLPLNPAASDPRMQAFDRLLVIERNGHPEPAEAFRKAWGDKIAELISQASSSRATGVNSVIDKLLTQAGKEAILKLYGRTEGTRFIEQLYNKQAQSGLSQTLFGGSDTAYKTARLDKKKSAYDAVYNMMPWHFHPLEAAKSLREVGSAAYAQRNADQANRLFAQQGPENVGKVIDAVLANEKLRGTANPLIRNPILRGVGEVGATAQSQATSSKSRSGNRLLELNQPGQSEQDRRRRALPASPASGPGARALPPVPQRANQ